ncbi:MAG TPA: hypothetical protein VK775_13245 [Chthoniobacterales bacterium]|nr:hypothetical protein [Chthoniobacterales bacterium]
MCIGFARGSTEDQTIDLQKDALKCARCCETYEEHATARTPPARDSKPFSRASKAILSWCGGLMSSEIIWPTWSAKEIKTIRTLLKTPDIPFANIDVALESRGLPWTAPSSREI